MKRILNIETKKRVGERVKVAGWVNTVRSHGKIIFVDLRDRSGLIQIVFAPDQEPEVYELAQKLRPEWVIEVEGKIQKRPQEMINPKIETGRVELQPDTLKVLSKAKTLPFAVDGLGYEISEQIRLKYRYLDLRRQRMTSNMRTRSKMVRFIREYLFKEDFVEIETPILTKSTPEGARDFIVPSRLQPGKFYALPQSPQQYKQLLMVAGFERYFQIARVFRDEDPRADRAYGEFTQLDIEMSFVTQEDILQLTERLFNELIRAVFPEKKITKIPWPRLSHAEAIKRYNSDKPDLRKNPNDKNELAFAWVIDFPLFIEQTEEDFFHGLGQAKFAPSHHMFTAPHPDDLRLLESNPLKVRGLQHDMVLNGLEVGGGSIRIHQAEVQEKVFELIGFGERQKKEFKHMLTAFAYGVPPHGGIAPGIDRFLMAVLGEPSVRETIAFPATSGGKIAVMDAPSEATKEQLKELHLKIIKKK